MTPDVKCKCCGLYLAVMAAILNFHKKTNTQGADIVNLKVIFLNARRIKSFFQIL